MCSVLGSLRCLPERGLQWDAQLWVVPGTERASAETGNITAAKPRGQPAVTRDQRTQENLGGKC